MKLYVEQLEALRARCKADSIFWYSARRLLKNSKWSELTCEELPLEAFQYAYRLAVMDIRVIDEHGFVPLPMLKDVLERQSSDYEYCKGYSACVGSAFERGGNKYERFSTEKG